MLIIFDLDDTLIDTTGGITPWKLEKILKELSSLGLVISDFNGALSQLLRINSNAESSVEALSEFLELVDAPKGLIDKAYHLFFDDLSGEIPISLFEGTKEILEELSQANHLAIVTAGRKPYQQYKIEKAGIDSSQFCTIMVCGVSDKKKCYASIQESLGIPPCSVCVCGDRVEVDLVPAKELGFKTVHFYQGRGMRFHDLHHFIDYKVHSISQLPAIIEQLKESIES